jgi:hypothetical protein
MGRFSVKGQELESAWTDANWPFTAEQDRAVFLAIAREAFSGDGYRTGGGHGRDSARPV